MTQTDLFEVAADRIRDAVGVRLGARDTRCRDGTTALLKSAGPPAENLRGPATRGCAARVRTCRARTPSDLDCCRLSLRAQAGHLPLRREFGQGELDQALHLFREQHPALLQRMTATGGEASQVPRRPSERSRGRKSEVCPGRRRESCSRGSVRFRAAGVSVPPLCGHFGPWRIAAAEVRYRAMDVAELKAKIRDIKNFPTEGILFKDITTLLKDGPAFGCVVDSFAGRYRHERVDVVVGDRVARLHHRRRARPSAERGLCSRSQARQAPGQDHRGRVRARVRPRRARHPRGRDQGRAARPRGRRSAGHRRHGGGDAAPDRISWAGASWASRS